MRVEGALLGGGGWLSLWGGCPTIREKGKGWRWGGLSGGGWLRRGHGRRKGGDTQVLSECPPDPVSGNHYYPPQLMHQTLRRGHVGDPEGAVTRVGGLLGDPHGPRSAPSLLPESPGAALPPPASSPATCVTTSELPFWGDPAFERHFPTLPWGRLHNSLHDECFEKMNADSRGPRPRGHRR